MVGMPRNSCLFGDAEPCMSMLILLTMLMMTLMLLMIMLELLNMKLIISK